jgi:hypothetical protein
VTLAETTSSAASWGRSSIPVKGAGSASSRNCTQVASTHCGGCLGLADDSFGANTPYKLSEIASQHFGLLDQSRDLGAGPNVDLTDLDEVLVSNFFEELCTGRLDLLSLFCEFLL